MDRLYMCQANLDYHNLAPTNWREDPEGYTRQLGGGGASGLISPLLDHRI